VMGCEGSPEGHPMLCALRCLQRLGAPLLHIALDILVGPTSSQERLLAARWCQEVIPRCTQRSLTAPLVHATF